MNFSYLNNTFYDECVNVIPDICDKKIVSTAILTINCLSVLINILHVIVLGNIPSLRSTKYFQVLMNCGASDAVASTVFAFITTCALEDTINRQSQHVISIANSAMEVIILAASMLRTYLIGISSYERYISLCDPFNYETNKVVQNIGSFFVFHSRCNNGSLSR